LQLLCSKLGTKLAIKKTPFRACARARIGHSHYSMPGKAHWTTPLSMHACMRVCVYACPARHAYASGHLAYLRLVRVVTRAATCVPPSFLSMLRLKLRRHRRVELGNMRASQRAPASPILLSFARFFCVSICTAVLAKQAKQVTQASARPRRRFSCPRDPRFASVFAL
jgi:hypothetical protein